MKARPVTASEIEAGFGVGAGPPMNERRLLDPVMGSPQPDAVEIYTDGSFAPRLGAGGWAFAVYRGADEIHAGFGGQPTTTNNRMELQAIIEALTWLDPGQPALVWSDSRYAVDGCAPWRHGWRCNSWTRTRGNALANADLWRDLDGLLGARPVEVRWTRGHVGTIGNERADELGRQAMLETARRLASKRA